jgi:para-aminobenzoate synthetase/4-amino-4-deoxychorismate lyase
VTKVALPRCGDFLKADNKMRSQWHPLPAEVRRLAAENVHSVLLETARQDSESDKSLLFLNPLRVLTAYTADELPKLLEEVDSLTARDQYVAGYFAYECGEAFVGLTDCGFDQARGDSPLAWLGIYGEPIVFDHASGILHGTLPVCSAGSGVDDRRELLRVDGLEISPEEYARGFDKIQEHLAAGDTYQVNFTSRVSGSIPATPLDVYAALLERQPVSFAAYLHLSDESILSFSPELFYRTSHGRVTVRPMKGTWPRGRDIAGDRDAAKNLQNDVKNRGEHITIVDLLRNDVGRIAEQGSVCVDSLMDVERYATLLQMTSTISARIRDGFSPSAVFRNLFPCGSITGAPKRKTMEIIRDVEGASRGVYTGAIGYFGPKEEACFNVAIRTMCVKGETFSMGVGGGVTADSNAADEYSECELKTAFLTRKHLRFSLIETMRCDGRIRLLSEHLERLASSAAYFDIRYDEDGLRQAIDAACRESRETLCKVRLELHRDGAWQIECTALGAPEWRGRILLATETTSSSDAFLHHKTTNRKLYNDSLSSALESGFNEVLFRNEHLQLTEGAISNVFLRVDGAWITPSLDCGVLPGVMRAQLLRELNANEQRDISLSTLVRAEAIILCNALRGMRSVQSLHDESGTCLWSL